jgi:hypothetical protein
MAEYACSSQSSESTSELPPLEELLRDVPIKPISRSKQAISKQRDCGDGENTRESSIDKDITNKRSISSSSRTSSDRISIDMACATGNRETNSPEFDPIPPLTDTSSAIFVPIAESTKLLSPPQFVPGSFDYHRAALNILTNHEATVRNNIQSYYQREMLRINREAEARDPSFDYFTAVANVRKEHEAALKQDMDIMIANMRERDNPAIDYNIKSMPYPDMDKVPVTYVLVNSPRESAARDVMRVIAAATKEISSFDNHVRCMSDAIKMQMQAAALREKQQGRMNID